ncbi:MAG: hypothetical protein ACYS9X_06280 [Planctomycetota bacterium]|jgi:hypothetical protein
MRYTSTELRLFDAFALILAGLGMLLLVVGVAGLATARAQTVVVSGRPLGPRNRGAVAFAVSAGASRALAPFLKGTVFLALGLALGEGVRRVVRNGGDDVADLPDGSGAPRSAGKR